LSYGRSCHNRIARRNVGEYYPFSDPGRKSAAAGRATRA